jgi:hypothetical protein
MFNWSKKKESADPAPAEAVSSAAAATAAVSAGETISPEIIAVITAAIAAMTDSASAGAGSSLIVRKISRIHGEKVTWSNAGLMECIDSRKF